MSDCCFLNTESASDISPYATFQLGDGTNTLLHNIMYQDHELMEGNPTPQTTVSEIYRVSQKSGFTIRILRS